MATIAERHVIVFTKYPIAGFAKTRLIPRLGAAVAADVSRKLSERCVQTVRQFAEKQPDGSVLIRIFYAGGTGNELEGWLGGGVEYAQQSEGELGARMKAAFEQSFLERAKRVIIVGTDIPEVSVAILEAAFDALEEKSVVVGPAQDGGYYLIGMKGKLYEALLKDIPWSTEKVLDFTKNRAAEHQIPVRILDNVLRDVDLPVDVEYLKGFIEIKGDTTGE